MNAPPDCYAFPSASLQPPRALLPPAASFAMMGHMATSSEAMAIALRHHQAGSLDEAIACYRRALELEPQNAAALSNLGAALQHQGKLDDAVASYRAALAIDPNLVQTLNNLGTAYKAQ